MLNKVLFIRISLNIREHKEMKIFQTDKKCKFINNCTNIYTTLISQKTVRGSSSNIKD